MKIPVKKYYRKRHGTASFGGTVSGHYRNLAHDIISEMKKTKTTISKAIEQEKTQRKKYQEKIAREKKLAEAEKKTLLKQAEINRELARDEAFRKRIRELDRRSDLIDSYTTMFNKNKARIDEYEKLRDSYHKHLKSQTPHAAKIRQLKNRQELEKLRDDIIESRSQAMASMQALSMNRAWTLKAMSDMRKARTEEKRLKLENLAKAKEMQPSLPKAPAIPTTIKQITSALWTAKEQEKTRKAAEKLERTRGEMQRRLKKTMEPPTETSKLVIEELSKLPEEKIWQQQSWGRIKPEIAVAAIKLKHQQTTPEKAYTEKIKEKEKNPPIGVSS